MKPTDEQIKVLKRGQEVYVNKDYALQLIENNEEFAKSPDVDYSDCAAVPPKLEFEIIPHRANGDIKVEGVSEEFLTDTEKQKLKTTKVNKQQEADKVKQQADPKLNLIENKEIEPMTADQMKKFPLEALAKVHEKVFKKAPAANIKKETLIQKLVDHWEQKK